MRCSGACWTVRTSPVRKYPPDARQSERTARPRIRPGIRFLCDSILRPADNSFRRLCRTVPTKIPSLRRGFKRGRTGKAIRRPRTATDGCENREQKLPGGISSPISGIRAGDDPPEIPSRDSLRKPRKCPTKPIHHVRLRQNKTRGHFPEETYRLHCGRASGYCL